MFQRLIVVICADGRAYCADGRRWRMTPKPTLAFMRFGGSTLISIAESAILDTLEL